jgi:hypothetical protein
MLVVKGLQEVPSGGHDFKVFKGVFKVLEGVKVKKELLLRIGIWVVNRIVIG